MKIDYGIELSSEYRSTFSSLAKFTLYFKMLKYKKIKVFSC